MTGLEAALMILDVVLLAGVGWSLIRGRNSKGPPGATGPMGPAGPPAAVSCPQCGAKLRVAVESVDEHTIGG